MIAPQELLEIKQRMLIASEAAYKIASTSDQFVMHDQEQYELVIGSLLALKSDVRRLLAEHDILRGMFAERLGAFFMEGLKDGSTGSAETVSDVSGHEDRDRGEEVRPDSSGSQGDVLRVPATRKRVKRSKPRADRKRDGDVPVELGRGHGTGEVDGGKDA